MRGQALLTDHELSRLRTRNQHGGDGLTVVEWQVVKGAAMAYQVQDWTAVADASLTYEENVDLMRRRSTVPGEGGPTMKHMPVRVLEARPR